MNTLYLLLLIPLVIPLILKLLFPRTINFQEVGITIVVCAIAVGVVYAIGAHSQTKDFEIWNGLVTSKTMKQQDCPVGWQSHTDSFCSEYDTREVYSHTSCTTNSSGTQSCTDYYDTEYEYDFSWERRWYVHTTLGTYQINRVDRQGANKPNRYHIVEVKDPVSSQRYFKNLVKAVPDSILNNQIASYEQFSPTDYPVYPTVSDYYHLQRVINMGVKGVPVSELNFKLSQMMGTVGPMKQANLIVVFTSITNKDYKFALEHAWVGGKKNDIVVIISSNGTTFNWVDSFTWLSDSGNGIFNNKISKRVNEVGTFDVDALVIAMRASIVESFDRPTAESVEYLEDQIEPPLWAIVTSLIIQLLLITGLTFYFHHNDINVINVRRRRPR